MKTKFKALSVKPPRIAAGPARRAPGLVALDRERDI